MQDQVSKELYGYIDCNFCFLLCHKNLSCQLVADITVIIRN